MQFSLSILNTKLYSAKHINFEWKSFRSSDNKNETQNDLHHQQWRAFKVAYITRRGLHHQQWRAPKVAYITRRGSHHQQWCTPLLLFNVYRGHHLIPYQSTAHWYKRSLLLSPLRPPQIGRPFRIRLPHPRHPHRAHLHGEYIPGARIPSFSMKR